MLRSKGISIPISISMLSKNSKNCLLAQYNICPLNLLLKSEIMIILFREEALLFKWIIIPILDLSLLLETKILQILKNRNKGTIRIYNLKLKKLENFEKIKKLNKPKNRLEIVTLIILGVKEEQGHLIMMTMVEFKQFTKTRLKSQKIKTNI